MRCAMVTAGTSEDYFTLESRPANNSLGYRRLDISVATRRAAAGHPATNRYSGPNDRVDANPTKYRPGTLLSKCELSVGAPR